MKKIVIFIMILSFVFIGTLSAQGNLGFGVKCGLNMAKLTGDDADLDFDGLFQANPGFVFGPTIGGFVTYNLNDKLAAQAELLFTTKGSSYELDYSYLESGISMAIDGSMDMKMNWLDIPILVVFNPNDKIKIFAGPSLEVFLNGTTDYEVTVTGTFEGEPYSDSASESVDIESDEINSPGFGLIFGGAYMLGNNLEVEARYALGLTSWNKDEEEEEVGSVKNSGIQILINYYLKK